MERVWKSGVIVTDPRKRVFFRLLKRRRFGYERTGSKAPRPRKFARVLFPGTSPFTGP
jgi:hypothetical protein